MALDVIEVRGLMNMSIPEIEWAVPGLFPEGLVLFAGKQKLGKSFFLLNVGLAIAEGREVVPGKPIEQGRALYLALEDRPGRLQNRLDKMLEGREAPEKLDFALNCKKLLEGGIEDIEDYLILHADTKIVMIDVLEAVKPKHKNNADSYEESYQYLTPLKKLAEKYHVCIIVVVHMRKSTAHDVIDEIYGCTGLSAVPDTIVILSKETNGEKTLLVKGRDIQEEKYRLHFDSAIATWQITLTEEQELAQELELPSELAEFIRFVEEYPNGVSRRQASNRLGKSLDGIDSLVRRAVKEGKVKRDKGVYFPVVANVKVSVLVGATDIFDDPD